MSHQLARRWFTVSEYNRMAEAGILAEDDRVELIEGEIVEMSPIGSRHAACVNRLNTLLSSHAGLDFIVSVQNPVAVDDYSVPEPGLALLRLRDDYYAQGHPQSPDVILIIEIADTSIETDRNVKIPLYARTGIPVTMLIDLPKELIEVHSEPVSNQYQSVKIFRSGDSFQLDILPQISFSVDAILGSRN